QDLNLRELKPNEGESSRQAPIVGPWRTEALQQGSSQQSPSKYHVPKQAHACKRGTWKNKTRTKMCRRRGDRPSHRPRLSKASRESSSPVGGGGINDGGRSGRTSRR